MASQRVVILLAWLAASEVAGAACRRRWCKFSSSSTDCLIDSSALVRWTVPSLQGCLMKAGSSVDDLVVQWNGQTGACSLFTYQQVCRLLQPGTNNGSVACSVYRAAALVSCDAVLMPPLLGVWLAAGGSRLSNLVCQSEPSNYRMVTWNLQWADEGAIFNGVSSYALINDSRFFNTNTSGGFTWLMRLRRKPQVQPFMEVIPCNTNSSAAGRHFWEYNSINQMFYNKHGWNTDANNFRISSIENALPSDSNAWINIGISIDSDAASSAFFCNKGFIDKVVDSKASTTLVPHCYLSVGRRLSSSNCLNGVVQAVAVANRPMTEQEILAFFAVLP